MIQHVQEMIRQRIQTGDSMNNPECGKDKRVVDGLCASPNIGKMKWPDNDRILGKMRFVVPNKPGVPDASVADEDERDQRDR